MCEIFPEINSCFHIIPNRIALIFIAIWALMSGLLGLSIAIKLSLTCCPIKRNTTIDFESLYIGFENITATGDIEPQVPTLVRGFITIICLMFIVIGLVLLVANLLDVHELVFIVVWGIMINVVLGFIVMGLMLYQCLFKEIQMCILNGVDWFTCGIVYTGVLTNLVVWIYFAAIANTYMEEDS